MYLSDDEFLRRHGFVIHSRPRSGVTLWRRGGRLYTQEEAIKVAAKQLEYQRQLKGGLE